MNNPLSVPETTTATPNQWTTYTVTNSDDIYLTDKFIHSSDGLPLEPNETYTASSTVTLPSYVAGSGYLLFKTDASSYQTESNENDNVYAQALDIALPNLIITDVTAPTAAGAGQSITLSWTGKNDSSIAATNSYWYSYWYDQVVFSTNNIYGDSDDIYLTAQYIHSGNGLPLEPNETYTASSTVTLPSYVAGSGYLLFKTDASSYQTESNENDNVYAQALDIVDNPPTVLNPITDVNVDEDAANTVIDLTNVFTDIDNDIALIVKSVFVNDNPGLVTATIAGNQLTLDYQDNKFGTANITIRGTSNGKTVDDTFVITVNPVDDAPIVLNPITDVNVDEDAANTVIDLTPVFSDPDGDVITKSVLSNTNTSLVTATIVNNQLILDYLENKFGTAQITIRGTSKGLFVEDTFTITVNQVTKGILITGTSGNDNLVGGDGNDTLQGLAGNDTLNGGLGSDSLEGGNGNDVYYVDNSGDIVLETVTGSTGGTDLVYASVSYTLPNLVENLTLTGNSAINGTGNTLNNTIIGNNGNNYLLGDTGNDKLDGKAGVDTLDGGEGNDTYTIDNVNDVIIDSAGTDTVIAPFSYTLGC
jgi:Ca2+-binding RTX toxin-like protein